MTLRILICELEKRMYGKVPHACIFMKKRPQQMLFCESCEILQNKSFYRAPPGDCYIGLILN